MSTIMIRQLVREMLLAEIVELSPRTDLYHRTTANLQPGDAVEGKRSSKSREESTAAFYTLAMKALKGFLKVSVAA